MTNKTLHFLMSSSQYELINFLIRIRVIKEEMLCSFCGKNMHLKPTKDCKECYNWRCLNGACCHYQTTKSVKTGSFFESFRSSIRSMMIAIHFYAHLERQIDVINQCGLNKGVIKSMKKTLCSKFKSFFSENPIKLGGPGVIVQVDETKLNFNVKSHWGNTPSNPCWAVCIVDTSTTPAIGYVEIVARRDSSTLMQVINRVVRPNSTIYTDEWRAYSVLSKSIVYNHATVVHKYNFVDPHTGVHTQHVESFNNKLKYVIKLCKGIKSDNRKDFLIEFMFRDMFKGRIYEKILDLIKV